MNRSVYRIANALEQIAKVLELAFDLKKKALRMVDVDRANVYKKHLGKTLRKKQ